MGGGDYEATMTKTPKGTEGKEDLWPTLLVKKNLGF